MCGTIKLQTKKSILGNTMKPEFKISLLENGIHSFNKGLDTFIAYERSTVKNRFQLKEAIMFLHHGTELLLKQALLISGGEYLILSNLAKDNIIKIAKAKRENKSIFDDTSVHTASFIDIVERVGKVYETEMINSLESGLKRLNKYRNNIEHYGIGSEKETIENLLLEIRAPLLDFFVKAGINIGSENEGKWRELENELIVEVSTLRFPKNIKRADLQGDVIIIEYLQNFDKYKALRPESEVTEAEWETYWSTNNQIVKALNGGSVKLIKNLIFVNRVKIKLPFKDNVYSIDISRTDVEEYMGCTFEQIRDGWTSKFAALIVHDKEFSTKFFERFGTVKKIE